MWTHPTLKLHKEMFKKYVERLVILWVPENSNESEQGDPYFTQPKPKTNHVHFISDFRNLNKELNHKPYPMHKIN